MRLLCQIGKQSKYLLTASELVSLEIHFPGFQREQSEEHIQQIVAHQQHLFKTFGYYLFPGSLCFGRHDGALHCLDGQHRFHCMKELLAASKGLGDFEVVIEIIDCQQKEDLYEWFVIINSNRPIPEFLLGTRMEEMNEEKAAGAAAPSVDRVLELREHIRTTYAAFLSKSDKPQRPNIKLDRFMDEICKRYDVAGMADPIAWLEAENAAHEAYLETQRGHEQIGGYLDAIREKKGPKGKVLTHRFYLGVYWLDTIKNTISAQLRNKVWKTWWMGLPAEKKLASGEALCPCCEETLLSGFQFQAGHRVAFRQGGLHELSNLIPLCSACNLSMGVMNYEEYRATLHR